MSEKTTTKKQRVIYYSIVAVMLLLIGIVTVIAITQNQGNPSLDDTGGNEQLSGDDGGEQNPDPKPDDGSDDKPNDNPGSTDETPVVEVISFIMPVKGGTVIKEFTEDSVVFSSTLGVYTGHLGMDFSGAENASVVAAYKGTIKEITTNYLTGTTVKIDHGSGLYTVYNSIEPSEGLKAGQTVEKGDVLGTISTNNKREKNDGAHLHFEVIENGTTISPLKYLTVEEK